MSIWEFANSCVFSFLAEVLLGSGLTVTGVMLVCVNGVGWMFPWDIPVCLVLCWSEFLGITVGLMFCWLEYQCWSEYLGVFCPPLSVTILQSDACICWWFGLCKSSVSCMSVCCVVDSSLHPFLDLDLCFE